MLKLRFHKFCDTFLKVLYAFWYYWVDIFEFLQKIGSNVANHQFIGSQRILSLLIHFIDFHQFDIDIGTLFCILINLGDWGLVTFYFFNVLKIDGLYLLRIFRCMRKWINVLVEVSLDMAQRALGWRLGRCPTLRGSWLIFVWKS